ncbi:hypothetical protein ACFV9C_42935 [Kribbella sp. NPDC059898]|uniref:hypothetical protein n=1 Tax=Kribbella sp. NPDC059898 TaxID=3346995 RepID=UPI003668E303
MSVTFTIESNPTGAFQFDCHDGLGPVRIQLNASSYESAVQELAAHEAQCATCGIYGACVQAVRDVDDDLDVNVAQTNAVVLLYALGLHNEDLSGGTTAQDFFGRVMFALAEERDDTGIPASDYRHHPQGLTLIDCGIRPGYYADVFGRLSALAAEAIRLGRDIEWC